MPRITVENIGVFSVQTGVNLRAALRAEGVFLDGTCADEGRCGRCIVRVLEGDHGEATPSERGLLGPDSVRRGERLACRVNPASDLRIRIDAERILEVDRSGRWKETWQSPLWSPESVEPTFEGYGVAVDLGTTSVAAALYDMAMARPLDVVAGLNPQTPWGEEILSRMAAARDPEVAGKMRAAVWRAVSDQIRSLCMRNGVGRGRLRRMVVVGNPAMHHLALGLPTESLLTPPFEPVTLDERVLSAVDLEDLDGPEGSAQVVFPPLVGGFVGSDVLTAVRCALEKGGAQGCLIDVGTNTEVVVWKGDRIAAASAPAGPAFEGGHIRSGMRAEEGAIYRVSISRDGVRYETIGDASPRGICGTGIVDLLAGMLREGLIDATGLMRPGTHPCLDETGLRIDGKAGVLFEPGDVETVQKAKAAVRAALDLLAARVGLVEADLERIYLAGAFGSRLDALSAIAIGLLPPISKDRCVPAGNTALVGASTVLLSEKAQAESARLARQIDHVAISGDPGFEESFLENLFFT